MKPYLLQTLKEIALLGGIQNKVEISSFELGKRLNISQQSASRYLLELDKIDMINREFGIKKQLIKITKSGENKLQNEYVYYQQIFELTDRIIFTGRVVSGLGEGRYYTEQNGYVKQFKEKLGFIPYPGTLNVRIDLVEKNKLRQLRNQKGIKINEFNTINRTFGEVKCFRAQVNKIKGAIVLPIRTHYSNIVELISPIFLRQELKIEDEDEVNIVIFFEK
jgi:riboflavin kinase